MNWTTVIWEFEVADGNVQHVAEHGLTPDDVDPVIARPDGHDVSHASGLPALFGYFGYTDDSRHIIVIYEEIDADTIRPVTAAQFRSERDETNAKAETQKSARPALSRGRSAMPRRSAARSR